MKIKNLNNIQRKKLSTGLIELANFILIALFFGQFIAGSIVWRALIFAFILSIIFYLISLRDIPIKYA